MNSNLTSASWQQLTLREIGAGLGLGLLYPFRLPRRASKARRLPREQQTVVLIHGYLSNRTAFFPLQAYLRLHGVRNILSFEYRANQSAEKSAKELADFLKANVRGGQISFVCHSLGGIIARIYLQMLGGHRRCTRCITIGSPHQGTYNAFWVPSKIGRQLRPDSELLAKLEQTNTTADDVRFVAIAGDADNIILPRNSAGEELSYTVANTGHLGLLWSPKTMKIVLDELLVSQP